MFNIARPTKNHILRTHFSGFNIARSKRNSSKYHSKLASTCNPFSKIPVVKETIRVSRDFQYKQLLDQHGPVYKTRDYDGSWIVVAHGPQAAKAMYEAEGKYPSKGKHIADMLTAIHRENSWQPSMAFLNGPEWKKIRLAVRKQATLQWAWQGVEPLCQLAVWLGEALIRGGDIRKALSYWAYQGNALYILGEIGGSYNNIDHTHKAFMEAGLKFTRNIQVLRDQLDHITENVAVMRRLGTHIMNRKHQQMTKGEAANTPLQGMFQRWISDRVFSKVEAAVHCVDLLATSFDATANTGTFLLFELAKQPLLQEKLHREINMAMAGDRTTAETIQSTRLLRDCVKETLRLYPPMTVARREVAQHTKIAGHRVFCHTNVHVTLGLMSHDPTYFYQPMKFQPERWRERENIQPFSYFPFGFGSRACYGRRLAETQLYTLLYILVPQYKISTLQQTVRVQYTPGPVAMEPIHLILQPRINNCVHNKHH